MTPALSHRLQLAPAYRIADPSDGDRLVSRAVGADPACAAVLVPVADDWRTPRSIDRDTLALLRHLAATDGRTPAAMVEAPSSALTGLVLDGVLELVEGTTSVSGPAAHPILFGPPQRRRLRGLPRVSQAALHDAARAPGESSDIARRLYAAHRLPASPRARRARTPDALAASLPAPPAGVHTGHTDSWWTWHAPSRPGHGKGTSWKVYVSPYPEALVAATAATVACVGQPGLATAAKVGRRLTDLLRPDKLVAYCDSRAAARRTARRIASASPACRVHGVPFTESAGGRGLCSLGLDLPPGARLGAVTGSSSWRAWLTEELASALALARRAGHPDPVSFALDRVALEGVDTRRWRADPARFPSPDAS